MSPLQTFFRCVFFLAASIATLGLAAETWRYGSVYVAEVPEGMDFRRLGGDLYPASEIPGFFPGMVRFSGAARDGLFFRASNSVVAAFFGPGELNIERFEQDTTQADRARSRMIISMPTGVLTMDTRELARTGQVLIELPIGKVFLNRAVATIDLSLDERSGIYSFQMIAGAGSLRYTDNQGQRYFASQNQLLTGAGDAYGPTLQVSDVTRRMREGVDRFSAKAEALLAAALGDPGGFGAHMVPIPAMETADESESTATEEQSLESVGGRPIVIEHVPAAKPLVPFRGETRSLSEREAALF